MKKLLLALLVSSNFMMAQEITTANNQNITTESSLLEKVIHNEWYNKIKIGGYMQLRYNDLLKTNPLMENPQGDRTYGGYDGFSLRRMRFKVSGQIHPRVYFYFQADFASDGKYLGQLRDAYMDISLDKEGSFKFRGGQSKIPFGYENLQSSQNRYSLDRNDPLNSAVKDERDLSIGIHWAPLKIRKRYKDILSENLKGSGDYGVAYVMIYNGQKANTLAPNVNKFPHLAIRLNYPFMLSSGQYFEAGIFGFSGKTATTDVTDGVTFRDNNGTVTTTPALNHLFSDQRFGTSFVWYPQPFGIQAEYNFGIGPRFLYDPILDKGSIGEEQLHGGYLQIMYKFSINDQYFFPFSKYSYYVGGKKFEKDARAYNMNEFEIGIEWQPLKAIELNLTYVIADRRYEDMLKPINRQTGNLLRIQLQVNY